MMDSRCGVNELLEQHFDTAFAAPDGIKKLRELILTLAMQGKLVAQDLNDPPASELLKAIEAEKQHLIKNGKIKQPKPLPPIKPEEVPYELPGGWEWVRFGEIAYQITDGTHHTPKYIEEGIPFLSVKDMSTGCLDFSDTRYISSEQHQELIKRCYPQKGDLLLTKVGTTGIPVLVDVDCEFSIFVSVALIKFSQNLISGKYLSWMVKTPLVKKQSEAGTEGIGNKNLVLRKIANFLLVLPPLPEQHRIIAKIDQLMAKCDELERLCKEREEKRLAVHAAAIKQLLDNPPSFPRRRESSSTEELESHSPSAQGQTYGGDEKRLGSDSVSDSGWDFIQQHFSELYAVKENVAELRKAILQLAVMGRLVPQDPNDPPTSELLKAIEAEKQQLVKDGKIKQPKPLPPIKPEEVPYELPDGWEWVRFGEITINRDGERIPVSKEDRGKIKGEFDYYGASGVIDKVNDFIFDKSLLLIGEDGANLISRSTPIAFMAHGKYWVNNHAHVIDAHDHALLLWLEKYMNTIDLKPYITGSAQPKMNQAKMNSIAVALPPLPEQQRIVAKIDQLMALCDTLEQQIDAATGKQTDLLNAMMGRYNQ